MKIINLLDRAVEAWAASLELWATERRTGITVAQAVAYEQGKAELLALGGPELAAEVQRIAIELAKSGVTEDHLEALLRHWMRHQVEITESL